MSASVVELAVTYARLGLRDWPTRRGGVRNASAMGVRIATHLHEARQAVEQPFDPESDGAHQMRLLPIPRGHRRVPVAFFAPRVASRYDPRRLAFDLVVLQQMTPVAFRFEPGSQLGGAHGYDHVQLSGSVGGGKVQLMQAPPLPATYPAAPLPTRDEVARLLALIVAMHGYPDGVKDVFRRAFGPGRSNRHGLYLRMTEAMLGNDS